MTSIPSLNISQRQHYFLLFLLLISLALFLFPSLFVHPAADDYCVAFFESKADFWQLYSKQYMTWSGRYSTNVLAVLNPTRSGNLTAYRLMPAALVLLTLFAMYYLLRSITERKFSALHTFNFSLLFLITYLSVMPAIAEVIYWYTSAVVYQTGIIFSLIYLGLLFDLLQQRFFVSKYLHYGITVLCLITALGFNEGITLLLCSFHPALIWYRARTGQKLSKSIYILLAIATVFGMIMLMAPGNMARSGNFAESHDFFHSLSYTVLQMFRFSLSWSLSLPCLIASLLVMILWSQFKDKNWIFRSILVKPVFISVFMTWIFFVNIFPAYWSTNILGQHRTLDAACIFFLAAWPVFLSSCASALIPEKLIRLTHWGNKHIFTLLLALLLSAFISGNGYSLLSDIFSGRIQKFDRDLTERRIFLEEIENKETLIHVKPLKDVPSTLFVLDLSEDPTHWTNFCQAHYFGVKQIVCKK